MTGPAQPAHPAFGVLELAPDDLGAFAAFKQDHGDSWSLPATMGLSAAAFRKLSRDNWTLDARTRPLRKD